MPQDPNITDNGADQDAAYEAFLRAMNQNIPAETLDSLKTENAALLAQLNVTVDTIASARRNNDSLRSRADDAKAVLQDAKTDIAQGKIEAIAAFGQEFIPLVEIARAEFGALMQNAPEGDKNFASLAKGFEKSLDQLKCIFNKYGVKAGAPAVAPDAAAATAPKDAAANDAVQPAAIILPPVDDTLDAQRARKSELQQKLLIAGDELTGLQKESTTLRQRTAESRQLMQRHIAEAQQEKTFALQPLVGEILPSIDSIERGLQSVNATQRAQSPHLERLAVDSEDMLKGFLTVFNRHGVHQINPVGKEFDENKHEAVVVQANDDLEPETVVAVLQKGYEICAKPDCRLIRAAKVIVTPA